MHADRHRHHQEQDEGNPSHAVGIDPAADSPRHDGVICDVGRHQPEIDDGVQRPGEEHPGEAGIDGVFQAGRDRNDLQQQFERGADCGPGPEIGARNIGEHRKRHRGAGIGLAPDAQIDRHQRDPDPRADHDQDHAKVIENVADQRRVERVEHRGAAERDRDHRHDAAGNDQPETGPGPAHPDQPLLQRGFTDGVAEAHRDQRREDVAHHRAVRGQRAIIEFGIGEPGADRAADEHLPGAERERDAEYGEGQPEMSEDELPIDQHSSASRHPSRDRRIRPCRSP